MSNVFPERIHFVFGSIVWTYDLKENYVDQYGPGLIIPVAEVFKMRPQST